MATFCKMRKKIKDNSKIMRVERERERERAREFRTVKSVTRMKE